MTDKTSTSMLWLYEAIFIACAAYVLYGSTTAVAAYVLINIIFGVLLLVSIIPVFGIFIYIYWAIYAGTAILTMATLTTGTSLFYIILIVNCIGAAIVCLISTFGLIKVAFD